MTAQIHPTAIVSPKAKIGEGVKIGPYAIIEDNVVLGDQVEVGSYVHISGWTEIGEKTKIFPGAVLGTVPQDLKFSGEKTRLRIGKNNIIREYVMINPGTSASGETVIGDNNLLMAYVHVAHDCRIGDNCIIANVGTLAGHVEVGNRVVIGGLTAIHQFVRIGDYAILGGCSKVVQDVPPYAMVDGHPARIYSINRVGLKRAGFAIEDIRTIKQAYEIIFFSEHTRPVAIKLARERFPDNPLVEKLLKFLLSSRRGVCRGIKGGLD